MNLDEANRMASMIRNTWRGGPSVDVWRDELLEMDAGTAGTAMVRLMRELETPPSIARFWREYRGLATGARMPVPTDPCVLCDDTGWTVAPELVVGRDVGTHRYSQVQPCRACRGGEQARAMHQAIARHNAWRTLPDPGDRQPDPTLFPSHS